MCRFIDCFNLFSLFQLQNKCGGLEVAVWQLVTAGETLAIALGEKAELKRWPFRESGLLGVAQCRQGTVQQGGTLGSPRMKGDGSGVRSLEQVLLMDHSGRTQVQLPRIALVSAYSSGT